MDRVVQDEAYIPLPFPKHLVDDHEWMQILATVDICTIPRSTQFCDENGNDIVPICMVNRIQAQSQIEDSRCVEHAITISEVSVADKDYMTYEQRESGYTNDHDDLLHDVDIDPESEPEKV